MKNLEVKKSGFFYFFTNLKKESCYFVDPNVKIKAVCQMFSKEINIKLDSLDFDYQRKPLNFGLTVEEIITKIDKNMNAMYILVKKKEEFKCPKCGSHIQYSLGEINNLLYNFKDDIEKIESNINVVEGNISKKSLKKELKDINKRLNASKLNLDKVKPLFKDSIKECEISKKKKIINPKIIILLIIIKHMARIILVKKGLKIILLIIQQ